MGLPVVRTGNVALDRFLEQVREHIESQKATTGRDRVLRMSDMPGLVSGIAQEISRSGAVDMDKLAAGIANTKLFSSLMQTGSAVYGRLEGVPRTVISDIRTASDEGAASATSTAIMSASGDRSVSALVTEVTARLDGFTEIGEVTATIEEAYLAMVDRVAGAEAQYTVKVTAGGAVAGFGLAATDPVDGDPESAFLISADKFAIVQPSYSGGLTNTPNFANIPFGVDASGVYINGQVRINANGAPIQDGVQGPPGVDGQTTYTWIAYANNSTGTSGFTTGANTGQTYIGIASNKLTATESTNPADYVWSLIKGADGAPGTPGTAGARGSLTGYGANYGISSASWSDAQAQAVIYNMINGTTQTSNASSAHLRVGDTVTLSGPSFSATKFWGGSWLSPGVTIDGNLLVNGTIAGNKIVSNAINSGHIGANTLNAVTINTSGSLRATGSYTEGSFTFQGASMKSGGVFSTTGGGIGYPGNWLVGGVGYVPSGIENALGKFGLLGAHYIASNLSAISGGSDLSGGVAGLTDTGSAVYGYATGNGSGLVGHAVGASGYSLKLTGSGRVLWGGRTIEPPPNNDTTFLRADGVWGAATGPQGPAGPTGPQGPAGTAAASLMNLTSASFGAPSGTAYTLNVVANGTPFRILAYYP